MSSKEKSLQQKRELASARILDTVSVGRTVRTDPSQLFLFQAHYSKLESNYKIFEDSHFALIINISDNEAKAAEDRVRREIDSAYFEALSIHNELQAGNPSSNTSPPSDQKNNIRLPKLNLVTFNGDFKTWPTFLDMYNSMIHSNPGLSNIEKFQYLMSSLAGEPRSLLKSFILSDANYDDAYKTLVNRYQNKRKLAFSYWEEITNVAPKKASASEIRRVLDVFSENISLLKNLGLPVDHWDFVLFHTLVTKLDFNTRQKFEAVNTSTEMPSFKILLDFLESHCISLELSLPVKPLAVTPSVPSNKKPNANFSSTASLVVDTPPKRTEFQCPHCKAPNHSIMQCPGFKAKSTQDRYSLARTLKLCLNCLRSGHRIADCQSKSRCRNCNGQHHTMLHFGQLASKNPNNLAIVSSAKSCIEPSGTELPHTSASSINALTNVVPRNTTVLLATVLIEVKDNFGNYQLVRALLDSASQASFMTQKCCQRLGLNPSKSVVPVFGIGQTPSSVSSSVSCHIRAKHQLEEAFDLDALVISKICGDMPSASISTEHWQCLKGLKLADPRFNHPERIDMLLGADVFSRALRSGRVTGAPGEPTAINTAFGWVLMGNVNCVSTVAVTTLHATVNERLFDAVSKFWKVDSLPGEVRMSPEDETCERHFVETTQRDPSGRFIVSLPFKESTPPQFGDMRAVALRRFNSLERRLSRDPALQDAYRNLMKDYEDSGHMTLVPTPLVTNKSQDNCYYIPHHAVSRQDSLTTKLRVVFDASAKSPTGLSLNDTLMTGPKLQNDILPILLRFRLHEVALTADIKQMYRQILVHPADRNFQRILWRPTPDQPVQEYILNTVTYGMAPSPFLAIRTLSELASSGATKYPLASAVLRNDIYMDDTISGCDSVTEACQLQKDLIELLKEGQFELRKWASNAPALLNNLDMSVENQVAVTFDEPEKCILKILGLKWSPQNDTFQYTISPSTKECTKRAVLSDLARIFDPIGFLGPVTFTAKCIIQELWLLGLGWDDEVPSYISKRWQTYKRELNLISKLDIPRYILCREYLSIQLHGFCDASERGYGAVVYFRIVDKNKRVTTHLVCAKSRVAPLKKLSIPRLELCGASLLADLIVFVKTSCQSRITFEDIIAWTDSMIVLHWLKSQSSRYKPFVGNRIGQIQDKISPTTFRHVRSIDNPADPLSRGLMPAEILQNSLWWAGPPWLSSMPSEWPPYNAGSTDVSLISDIIDEESRTTVSLITSQCDFTEFISKYSSFTKLQRITGYCLRFIQNCRKRDSRVGTLALVELTEAWSVLIRETQRIVFHVEIEALRTGKMLSKPFRKLSPFLDKLGILRVGGRLENANLSYENKHPVLLPKTHPLTRLIIESAHREHLHPGLHTLHYILRQNYWILSPKRAIATCLSKCVQCFRAKPRALEPIMGDLPVTRIQEAKAFSIVGVDFGGPFYTSLTRGRGRKTQKSYVCIFVCHATKAVHIEIVSDLTSEAFIAALRRFVARRGKCICINCDRGTNFVGASRLLKEMLKTTAESQQITFQFNPPNAPHFGGLFEAGIKSIKTHLSRVVGKQILTFEELYTVLVQIEAVLNSRPLTPVSSDPNDLSVLTPGHFLTMAPLTTVPDPDLTHLKQNRLNRWQLLQQMHQSFWKRWHSEYLSNLNQRVKWNSSSPSLKEGSLVLLKEDNVAPLHWTLARVDKLHPGKDGVARVATIKTSTGKLQRPLVKLYPLPLK